MIRKMKPKTFTEEQIVAIKAETVSQSAKGSYPKSNDPVNFPVFEVPVNEKVLVYVPNHTIMNADTGLEELRMDKPLLHDVKQGGKYSSKVRCVKGLSAEAGYSGICPICEGVSEPWDLARELVASDCRKRGVDPTDKENDIVKEIKRTHYSSRVIKEVTSYYTFPIVVIETNPNNFKEIIFDENGLPKHKTYWYTISESFYKKTWGKALENAEDEPTHPGGRIFVLDYCYESKTGNYDKMTSAKELAVHIRNAKGFEEYAPILDKETEEWDQYKAMSTVINNMFYEEKELEDLVDEVLESTRKNLGLIRGEAQAGLVNGGTDNLGFGAMIPENTKVDTSNLPLVGETDAD